MQMHPTGLPVRASLQPTGLYLALREIGPEQLRDAFMQETVARVAARETIVHLATGEIDRPGPDSGPVGLIFHVARCGSTLISQSLRNIDDLVVYAEPQPVNEILVPPHKWPRGELVSALRALGAAFARHARKPYVLKLSSWNTLFCDILVEAYPKARWVLSLRDPVEVGVSLLARPPGWFRNTVDASRGLAGVVDPAGASTSREEFVARVYGAFCEAAARLGPDRGRLVPYETLPDAVWEVVAPHLGIPIDLRQRDSIARGARTHAKMPIGTPTEFVPDAGAKQAAASASLRRAVDSLARPHLERLVRLHAR